MDFVGSVTLGGMLTQEKDHGQQSEVSSETVEFWVIEHFISRSECPVQRKDHGIEAGMASSSSSSEN